MSSNLVRISIPNWEKYNDRANRKNFSWFRFENSFFRDHKLFHLSAYDKYLFIYLLCQCSLASGSEFFINYDLCSAETKLNKKDIINGINNLLELGVIMPPKAAKSGIKPHNGVLHNETNETDIKPRDAARLENTAPLVADLTRSVGFDFDLVYANYPNKKGKKKGMATFHRLIKTQCAFDKLLVAVKNYANENEHLQGEDRKYIKHFSTFMNCWEDYLDISPKSSHPDIDWDLHE